jgi:hypothetical protein
MGIFTAMAVLTVSIVGAASANDPWQITLPNALFYAIGMAAGFFAGSWQPKRDR